MPCGAFNDILKYIKRVTSGQNHLPARVCLTADFIHSYSTFFEGLRSRKIVYRWL
jgi:hypothetical protein